MSLSLPLDSRLYSLLLRIDQDLADEARKKGCPCGGVLHSACYPRKPRGGPADLEGVPCRRLSFCCDEDGCRSRVTPASVRFLGRKVYLAAIVVLVFAMRHGASPPAARKLRDLLHVDRRTLARWRKWWLEIFTTSPFWKRASGLFMPPVDRAGLPLSLLESFQVADEFERLVALLRFLGPLTTASPVASDPAL